MDDIATNWKMYTPNWEKLNFKMDIAEVVTIQRD
jgi:hypothetical protein